MELNIRTALGSYQTSGPRHLPNTAFYKRVSDKFGKIFWGVDLYLEMMHKGHIVVENK